MLSDLSWESNCYICGGACTHEEWQAVRWLLPWHSGDSQNVEMVCMLFHKSYASCCHLWGGGVPWLLKNTIYFFADVTDPVSDVLSFIRLYEVNYGYDHPVFYQGTYSQALNDAKQELRFLLVYLHCEEHQDTAKFCRWCTVLVSFAFLNK